MAQNKRKGMQPAASSGMKSFYYVLGAIAVLGVGFIVYTMMQSRAIATAPIDMEVMSATEVVERAQGIKRGPDDAPVKILVFADYTCPACKDHALLFGPIFQDSLLPTGKVQEVFYDFPLGGVQHPHSFISARAARCANEQDRFWEYHDLLFAKQMEWSLSGSTPTDLLVEYAGQIGLDTQAFEQCLRSDKYADVVTASLLLGQQLGVSSTPTIIINGRRPVFRTYGQLIDQIKEQAGI